MCIRDSQQLLAAAQRVFAEKGVSRTSLQDIALAAGASRGAIYWHFKNKADLFNAMMECAILPIEQAMQQIGNDAAQDPLLELENAILQTMRSIICDARTREIFEIATLKVEYVDELLAVKARHVPVSYTHLAKPYKMMACEPASFSSREVPVHS